eukprot:scaffold194561_cov34-Tisochrysis_lutea.AAC.2
MMWDVAAPALGEIIGMKGDFPERMTEDADLGSRREGAVAKIFYEMDDDSDGVVSEADFQRFVRSVRFTYDPVLTVFFNLIDVTGSGTVNQKEFASAITPVHAVAKEATLLAMGIDPAATDSPFAASGAASTEHTRATAAAALRKALATTFAEIDRNGDGAVSLDEFQRHFQALALKTFRGTPRMSLRLSRGLTEYRRSVANPTSRLLRQACSTPYAPLPRSSATVQQEGPGNCKAVSARTPNKDDSSTSSRQKGGERGAGGCIALSPSRREFGDQSKRRSGMPLWL